jgi:hypothetical protein
MKLSTFRNRMRTLIDQTLNDQFGEDEDVSFTDLWEAVRDRIDGVADDEDIADAPGGAEDDDTDRDDDPETLPDE